MADINKGDLELLKIGIKIEIGKYSAKLIAGTPFPKEKYKNGLNKFIEKLQNECASKIIKRFDDISNSIDNAE